MRKNLHSLVRTAILLCSFSFILSAGLNAQTAVAPALGDGSSGNPYQIATWQNLYWLSQSSTEWTKYYIQTANIDFAEADPAITTWDSDKGWSPIGNLSNNFKGSYNGQNHTISGLFAVNSYPAIGLFGYTYDAVIQNLGVTNVDLSTTSYEPIGGLIGSNSNSTVTNCYTTGSISAYRNGGGLIGSNSALSVVGNSYSSCSVNGGLSGTEGYQFGGLIGVNEGATVNNCYSTGDVLNGNNTNGGLVGRSYNNSYIHNCYSVGNVTGNENKGGLVGHCEYTVITNSYSTGSVSATNIFGGLVGHLGDGCTVTNSFWDTQTSGTTDGVGSIDPDPSGVTGKTTEEMTDYFTYYDAGWDLMIETVNGTNDYWGKNSSYNNGYPFLEWQGYTSIALPEASTQSASDITSVSVTGNGTIAFLGYPNPTQHGFCWNTTGMPTIADNKTEEGTVSSTGAFTSSITGLGNSTTYYVRAYATNSTGTVYGEQISFATPFWDGTGTSGDPYTISALNNLQTISNDVNYWDKHFIQVADIDASATSGWNSGAGWSPIGSYWNPFTGSYNGQGHTIDSLTIYRSGTDYQGFFGRTSNAIIQNLGIINVNITAYTNVGGLVGYNTNSSTISNCYSTGSVSAYSQVGGLVGYNKSTVSNCYSTGSVSGSSGTSIVGGLVGNNYQSTINNSYSTGSVSGSSIVGGLVGTHSESTLSNCYSTGSVSGSSIVGGLVGGNYSTVTNSFWDIETSNQNTSAGGTGKTTAEMKTQSTFTDAGWDFTGDWHLDNSTVEPDNNGYPSLAWQGLAHLIRPSVNTQQVTGIATTTATGNGNITELGNSTLTQHGLCWSTSVNPTINNFKSEHGTATSVGAFTYDITGLTPNTKYYVRAYAINTLGIFYGDNVSFTTQALPEVSTQAVTEITATTAIGNGTIISLGNPVLTEHGVCWSTSPNPGISDYKLEGSSLVASASANYNSGDIPTDFNFETTANNSACPGLLTVSIPINATITGVDVEYNMTTQNNGYMNEQRSQLRCVSNDGTAETSVAIGSGSSGTFSYSRTGLTIANNVTGGGDIEFELHAGRTWGGSDCGTSYNKVDNGTWKVTVHYLLPGTFTSVISDLVPFVKYYVRAYATNTLGTVYGDEVNFTTTGSYQPKPDAGKSISFNADDEQYIAITDVNNPTAYTVEMWVKPSGGTYQNIFNRCLSSNPLGNYSQQLYIDNDGKFSYYIWDGSGHTTTGTTVVAADTWYHVAITAENNGMMRLYVNGLEEGTAQSIGTLQAGMDQYRIACNSRAGTLGFFTGEIDEVRLWDYVRTQAEIQATYGSLAGIESNLTGYWRFDEGSGTITGDGSGNTKTGTLVNSPTWVNPSTAPVSAPVYLSGTENLDFGLVEVNTSKDEEVTITNNGGGILHISSIASDHEKFTVSPDSANIMADSCMTFTVTFAPVAPGVESGNLTLTHNPNGATNYISFSGTAPKIATVTTLAVTDITSTTATGNGDLADIGIPNATQHGVCWNTTGNPDVFDNKTEEGAATVTGAFTSSITGLSVYTTYYVRAYAINAADTVYGGEVNFTTLPVAITVSTQEVTEISTSTATGNGNIIDLGIPNPTQHGVCWNTTGNPDVFDSKTEEGAATVAGAFTSSITGLSAFTTYYVRAYAINAADTVYGGEVNFTTLPVATTVTTQAVTDITTSTATGNGNIIDLGVPDPTQHGVCWNTTGNPDVFDNKTEEGAATVTGAFTSSITGLSVYTTYYVRAYAINAADTVYGGEVNFTTLPVAITVSTQEVTEISTSTATGNGNIIDLGIPNPTQHGVCWNTTGSPDVFDSKTEEGAAIVTGAFTSSITGLSVHTTYYVRAYAINAADTVYGDEVNFTTSYFPGDGTEVNPFQIATLDDLKNLSENQSYWDKHYIQIADIDASATTGWNSDGSGGFYGWSPIGNTTIKFTGLYEGDGYEISGLYINRFNENIGFFGFTNGAEITNLTINNINIAEAHSKSGALIGKAEDSTFVDNCQSSGSVTGIYYVGGLIGENNASSVSNSSSSCTVNIRSGGPSIFGGLIGYNHTGSVLENCYATGSIIGSSPETGGLIGTNASSTVTKCYATGTVNGTNNVGGLIGRIHSYSTVSHCYATGEVNANGNSGGGFIGASSSSTIRNCYSTGSVTGISYSGGLVGSSDNSTIINSYSIGSVNLSNSGFLGDDWGSTITNCFWDTQTSGQTGSPGGTGKTTTEMKTLSTFTDAGWDFTGDWHLDNSTGTPDNNGYPSLAWQGLQHIILSSVTTQQVTSITTTTAIGNGNITDLGVPNPTQHGVCWNTTGNPDVFDSKTEEGAATVTGAFTSSITGLSAFTTYYVRAYAINAADTVYGNEMSFFTLEYCIPLISGLWNNPLVWGGFVPGAGDNVIIPPGITIEVSSVKETAECADLTIEPLGRLSVEGTLNVNGNLLVESDATGTGSLVDNGTLSVTGSSKAQQFLTHNRWWYITHPVQSSTSAPFDANTTDHLLYYWEETANNHGWSQIPNTNTTLDKVMKGYAVYYTDAEKTLEFTGTLNTGAQNINLTRTNGIDNEGFNLVGNPYPSAYDMYQFYNGSNVFSSVWYRTYYNGAMNFAHYNAALDVGVNGGQRYAPPMQAFWVKVADGFSTASISFSNANRTHNDTSFYKDDGHSLVRLQISNNNQEDECLVAFDCMGSDKLDVFDTEKMHAGEQYNCQVYTFDGTNQLAINTLPTFREDKSIILGYSANVEGFYNISLTGIHNLEASVYLEDIVNGKIVDIQEQDYRFFSGQVTQNNRFVIHFTESMVGLPNALKTNVVKVYSYKKNIFVEANNVRKIQVSDMTGKIFAQSEPREEILHKIDMKRAKPGIYSVKVITPNGVTSKKVLIK